MLPSDATLAQRLAARFPTRLAGAEQWLGDYQPGFHLDRPAGLGGPVLDRRTPNSRS